MVKDIVTRDEKERNSRRGKSVGEFWWWKPQNWVDVHFELFFVYFSFLPFFRFR